MPGNEVGDRVHNFFEQGSFSQEQPRTQFAEALNNNVWGANERQVGGTLNPSSKNYSLQQSDIERPQNNQFSVGSHGLNFMQSNLRPEFVVSQSQLQQLNLNGYMHTSQAVNTRQNEANFLGADAGPARHNLTSKGLSFLESQQRGASQHINSASFGGSESPMNFNFLGGQQQMSGQQSGMLHSVPRQTSATSDAQLLQQQAMFMQELQRQQQLQQLDAMQRSAMGHLPNFQNQTLGQYSSAMNGNSMHGSSNYSWQSQIMAGNTHWQQSGHPSAMHAYSNGLAVTPEQSQAMRFMGLTPQQASQSLYGVPVTNSRGANPFSNNSMDKSSMHVPTPVTPFSGNPYVSHVEHANMLEGSTVSRSGSEGKSSFEHASSQGVGNVGNLGGFSQAQERNVPILEAAGQGYDGGSNVLPEKSLIQADTSLASSQAAVALDPTEEKILFGSDDNIWEAFGGTVGPSAPRNDAADLLNGFPSMQSGTWSALMQSAVAETSSGDGGMQEEWSGLGSQNSKLQSGNQQSMAIRENEKTLPVWVDSSQRAPTGSRTANNDVGSSTVTSHNIYHQNSGVQQSFPNQRRSPAESRVLQEGRRWLDSSQPKLHADERLVENTNSSKDISKTETGLWGHQQNAFFQPDSNFKMGMSHGHSNIDAAGPNLSNINVRHESSQMLPDTHSLDLWKPTNSSGKSGIDGLGIVEHGIAKGKSVLDTSANTSDCGATEMQWTENVDGRENSTDSHRSNISNHGQAGSLRENVWSDTGDRLSLHGGSEKSSGQPGRPPATRKFQYHPMGDVDMDASSYAGKQLSQSQSVSEHLPSGFKGLEAQQRFSFSSDMEKGRASNYQVAVRMSHGAPSSAVNPGHLHNKPAPFASSGGNFLNQMPTGQHMLELLHKVDQSKDQSAVAHLGSTDYNRLSDVPVSGPGQIQSSASHGFNLQLAPPSRGVAPSNLNDPGQSSLRMADSPSSGYVDSDKGDKHAWLTPDSSPLPPSHRPSKMESGSDQSGCLGDSNAESSQPNLKGNVSAPSTCAPPYFGNPLDNQHMSGAGGQMMSDQSVPVSSDSHAYHDQQMTKSQNQAVTNQSFSNLQINMANQSGIRPLARQMPASLHAVMAGSRKDSVPPAGPYLWNSQQQLLGAQVCSASDLVKYQFQSNAASETNSFTQLKDEPDGMIKIDASCSQSVVGEKEPLVAEARFSEKTADTAHEDSPARHSMDASPSCSAAVQKDMDTSDHSVKSSNTTHQNYSQLHQMQVMKSMGLDPSHRESKRLRGLDNGPEAQQLTGKAAEPFTGGLNSMVADPSMSRTSVSGGDMRMLSFSPQSLNRITSSHFPHGAVTSQDMLSFGHGDPQTFAAGNVINRAQQTGISPQMAPSWFEQYGAFKNGQHLSANNVPRIPMMKNFEQQFISGKSPNDLAVQNSVQSANSLSDTSQVANNSQISDTYIPSEHVPSLQALVPQVPIRSSVSLRPKKRKTATSDLLSWNKEIGQVFKRLQNLSSAEVDWAQSSNRLVKRVENETDTCENLLPTVRSRRRLILTTQLMQQVFRPPSSLILTLDARTNYEVVIYSIGRVALGDACSLISGTESDSAVESGKSLPGKAKTLERLHDQYFSKVMEDFMNRSKELENDLLRLDKRASILDFRLDCQDLERFSVINRFARFHGRSQVDGAETSDATAVAQKHFPQRYVYAHPMPRTVPERVQCLSL